MRRLLSSIALGGALLAAGTGQVHAQDGNFTYLGAQGNLSDYGAGFNNFRVGMYNIRANHLPTAPTIEMVCVDVMRGLTLNGSWDAYVTSLGATDSDLDSRTYFGKDARESYKQAIFLSTQFTGDASVDQWIHAAIWNLVNPTQNKVPGVGVGDVDSWMDFAGLNYASANLNYNYGWVVSDITGQTQELAYYLTPEPATMALVATGLVGLGLMNLRRRRKT